MIESLIGKVFGDLIVVALDENKTKGRKTYWKFKCVCGKEISIRADSLKKRKFFNCGCKEYDYIVENVNAFGLNVLQIYHKNNNIRVIIQDRDGYKADLTYTDIICNNGGFNFVDQRNPYSLENISLWLKINNRSFYLCNKNNYLNSNEKLSFYCNKCGDIFFMDWGHLSQGYSCNLCAGKYIGKYNNLEYVDPDLAKQWIKSEHNLLPSQVTSSCAEKVYWQCPKYESHKWWASINNRVSKGHGCPKCNESKGEKEISKFLNKNSIEFLPQFKFKNCINVRKLEFDFYLPYYNCLIEYDGELHEKPARWFDKIKAQKKLEDCQRNDEIKNKYCIDNDIPLLRIHYKDFSNIQSILADYLNL